MSLCNPKSIKSALLAIFFALCAINTASALNHDPVAQGGHQETEAHTEGKLDIKKELFSHIGDSHDWHIFSLGEGHDAKLVSVPLPVILYTPDNGLSIFLSSKFHHGHEAYNGFRLDKTGIVEKVVREDGGTVYDFSLTKNVLCLLISVALLLFIFLGVAKKYKQTGTTKAPSGFQNAVEPIITFIRDEVAKPSLGNKYMQYMPLLLTFFFFIWINNLLGLLPFGFNLTGNIACTAFLALIYFIVMLVKAKGAFWAHIFNPPGVPVFVKPILALIEFLSIFIKPVALALRLFANIFAGHTIIISIVCLIFIFGGMNKGLGFGFSPVSVAFTVFMFFLELLVAAIQAFIFTNLSAVFIGQAIEDHHHDEHEHAHAH